MSCKFESTLRKKQLNVASQSLNLHICQTWRVQNPRFRQKHRVDGFSIGTEHCIKVISWIRIRIEVTNRIRIRINVMRIRNTASKDITLMITSFFIYYVSFPPE
jgi:hypothetical protein